MNTGFEELVGSYVSRTEKPGSLYHAELVQSVCDSLRSLGYKPSSDPKKLRMTIRRLLAVEQEKTLSAATAKARKVSATHADDLVQEAWLEQLELGSFKRPAGSHERWQNYLRQQNLPFSIPDSLVQQEEADRPTIVEPLNEDDEVMYEAVTATTLDPETEFSVREAIGSLPVDMQEDLVALVVEEEPLVRFSSRKGVTLFEAQKRKAEVLAALKQGFDGA